MMSSLERDYAKERIRRTKYQVCSKSKLRPKSFLQTFPSSRLIPNLLERASYLCHRRFETDSVSIRGNLNERGSERVYLVREATTDTNDRDRG
jgi:hypothetical protein